MYKVEFGYPVNSTIKVTKKARIIITNFGS